MGNPATLQPKPFTSENQPKVRGGRQKGTPNRATVFKKLLALKAEKVLTDATAAEKGLTLLEAAALGQLCSARSGNTSAWKEIQDTIHGKIPDKLESTGEVTQRVIVEFIKNDGNAADNSDKG